MLDNTRSAIAGLSLVLKFGLDTIYSFGDIVIFIFCCFGLKLPIHAHFCGVFRGTFSQTWPPNKTISVQRFDREKKRSERQDSQKKAATVPIKTRIYMAGNLADVIRYAKFLDEIFRDYNFTGVEFCIFLLFALQHCTANALPVILCRGDLLFRSRRLCGVSIQRRCYYEI